MPAVKLIDPLVCLVDITMKLRNTILIFLAVFLLTTAACSQSRTNRLYRPCPGSTTPAVLNIESGGDIHLTPCSAHSVFAGSTNLTTLTGGFVGLATGNVPYWTGTTFANSNISYNSFLATVAIRSGTTAGLDLSPTVTTLGDLSGFNTNVYLDASSGMAQLYGNTTTIGQAGSELRIKSATDTLETRASIWDLSDTTAGWGVSTFKFLRTVTAGGTTGDQTINKPAGTVNIAGGASAVTVTNSTVTVNSIVLAIVRTNDATCALKNVVPAAGSFVINMTANCTAETSVGFLVTN